VEAVRPRARSVVGAFVFWRVRARHTLKPLERFLKVEGVTSILGKIASKTAQLLLGTHVFPVGWND
jgi:hypothetical protein